MSSTTQYHLKGRGFSGRAVRLRELNVSEVEQNLTAAAKLVSGDASVIELKKTEWRNGIKLMITEISEPCDDPFKSDVKWKKITAVDLDDLGNYFKAKDVAVLEQLYRETHEVHPSEVEAITGKAIPVSAD